MRRPLTWWLLLLAGCGAHISGNGNTDNSTANPTLDANDSPDAAEPMDAATAPPDAPPDAPVVLGPWGTPKLVGPAATTASEDDGTLSSNALELIFSLQNANNNNKQLYYTSRATLADPWTTPATKLSFNSGGNDQTPRFSADDKTLYFASNRGNTSIGLDIYSITRNTAGVNTWNGSAATVNGVSRSDVDDKWFTPCDGGRYVMVRSKLNDTTGDTDLFEGVLGQGSPSAITSLNTTSTETSAFLTQDCKTLYFASTRSGTSKLYISTRTDVTAPWTDPKLITDFKIGAGTDNQEDPWISPDGRTFALSSDASGSRDVYLSTR